VANQRRKTVDDGLPHTRGIQNVAEQHENRDRDQDERGHAFIHAADDHRGRNRSGEEQETGGREAEAECDRRADRHANHDQADHEDQDIVVAEIVEDRTRNPQQPRQNRKDEHALNDMAQGGRADNLHHDDQQHRRDSEEDGGDAEAVRNAQRRGGNEPFAPDIFVCRHDQNDEKGDDREKRERGDLRLPCPRHQVEKYGQPHMLMPLQRQDGADHHRPDEEQRADFVDPDDGMVKHVAGNDTQKQQCHDGEYLDRGDKFEQSHDCLACDLDTGA
jgi:hypothetical protein